MGGLTLDAGALMAFERNDRWLVALIARSLAHGYSDPDDIRRLDPAVPVIRV